MDHSARPTRQVTGHQPSCDQTATCRCPNCSPRPASPSSALGELVDTQAWDRLRLREGQCAKQAEQGVLAGCNGQASAQTGAGTSAQEQGDVGELSRERSCGGHVDASGPGSARRRFDVRNCRCRTRDDVPAGPVAPDGQQRDGPPDTAGRSSALERISIHIPDSRPIPPSTARQDGPQYPQEQPLLPRLEPPEGGGQRGEPHPPRTGDARRLLIVTYPQISDRAREQGNPLRPTAVRRLLHPYRPRPGQPVQPRPLHRRTRRHGPGLASPTPASP